ncbi:hypothetical protein [Ulvibacter antarcticus]|uniref:6-bladed beta-propeller protein n=1 Tax=Ulvibacter antarcticus TaxID=442714 RepID=A0A3L9Z416_9FLAO|nr:hypothetical protein [Ulvibacter antarcticus]RMA66169.1 hypothetical protein BXY75_0588 [Ulvibacter antarcticus]
MKNFISLLIMTVFVISFGHAQEEVVSFKIEESVYLIKHKESYSFSNTINGDLAIVLIEKKKVYAKLFDKDFQNISSFDTDALKSKYSNVLGYKIIDNKYYLVASNRSLQKFALLLLDFDKKKGEAQEIEIDFGKEEFLETVQYKNQLYIISANKDNEFVLRILNDKMEAEIINTIEIGDGKTEKNQRLLKRDVFMFMAPLKSNITKIDNRVPTSIEQAANQTKLYQQNNKLYLTFDDDDETATKLYIIDLETLELTSSEYNYPKGKLEEFNRYNSFILDDHIIQLGSSNLEMQIEVKNFDGGIIKEHYLEKETPIDIKNSPIIQEGTTAIPFVNRREMEETSKFLRKVSGGKIGITAYKDDMGYNATIGGYKEVATGGGGMMMMGGGGASFGVGGAVTVMIYNPTFYSYSLYTSTKSTFFNTHFDQDFNYVKKDVETDVFDRIQEYKKNIERITAEDVFFHNDSLYFGFFDMRDKYYRIIKM